jgi:hypothetical protein
MKSKLFSVLAIAAVTFLFSCKGKDGDVGPAGPAGPGGATGPAGAAASDLPPITEGFVKGTATGTNLDGTTFSYALDLEGNWSGSDNHYSYISSTETSIRIYKAFAGQGSAFENASISMYFEVPNMSSLSSISNVSFSINATKDLGNNKYQSISRSYYSGSPTGTATVTNLNYNSSTGILTGNYTVDFPSGANAGSLAIANGTFSTKLPNVVLRVGTK